MATAIYGPAFILGMLATVWTDLRERRIPNWITGPLFLGGLFAAWHRAGWKGLEDSLMGVGMAVVIWILPFIRAGAAMGGGDQKLALAAGAALGWQGTLLFCLLAGIGSVVLFAWTILREAGGWRGFVERVKLGWLLLKGGVREDDAMAHGIKTVPMAPILAPAAITAWLLQFKGALAL